MTKDNYLLNNQISFKEARENTVLNPWQVTGFTDAEGSFTYSLSKNNIENLATKFNLEFKVTQKSHSEGILYEFKNYFGCGSVVIDNRKTDTKKYHVKSLNQIIDKIIPHFDFYPCLTSKQNNFIDWKKIAFMMKEKKHLTNSGLQEIINITSKMNKNRSFEDKYNYCSSTLGFNVNNVYEKNKLSIIDNELPKYWVQTFLAGEGLFYNYVNEDKNGNLKIDSTLEVGQNNHDVAILLALKNFFRGGYIKPRYDYADIYECKNSRLVNRYIFRNTDSIIKFVDEYQMLTRKHLDYLNWKKIIEIKQKGLHKTLEGINAIKDLKNNMNSKRD